MKLIISWLFLSISSCCFGADSMEAIEQLKSLSADLQKLSTNPHLAPHTIEPAITGLDLLEKNFILLPLVIPGIPAQILGGVRHNIIQAKKTMRSWRATTHVDTTSHTRRLLDACAQVERILASKVFDISQELEELKKETHELKEIDPFFSAEATDFRISHATNGWCNSYDELTDLLDTIEMVKSRDARE